MVDALNELLAQSGGKPLDIATACLAPEAQPYQDLIDRIVYCMAGLTDNDVKGLEKRLEGIQ